VAFSGQRPEGMDEGERGEVCIPYFDTIISHGTIFGGNLVHSNGIPLSNECHQSYGRYIQKYVIQSEITDFHSQNYV
jgi:hypothetical protein